MKIKFFVAGFLLWIRIFAMDNARKKAFKTIWEKNV